MTEGKENPRELALHVLRRVLEDGAYLNLETNAALAKSRLSRLDRALAAELCYGPLRMQAALDCLLGQLLRQPLEKLPLWILLILRQAVYQMEYMDRIPARAAVNEAVKLARKYGHAGTVKLTNGVLRNFIRQRESLSFPDAEKEPVAHIAASCSFPEWMVEKWLQEWGMEETLRFCRAQNERRPLSVRVNTLRCTRQTLIERLAAEGVEARPCRLAPEGLLLSRGTSLAELSTFQEGLFQPQDESSMLAARALMPKPGEHILDLCAAPGGKTTHLAQLMENRGQIHAFDLHEHKISLIRENCARLGIDIVEAQAGDARQLAKKFPAQADGILLDAPCSGLGVLGRRPDLRWRLQPETVRELAALGQELLAAAADALRPGGRLLFSTCTVTAEENEEAVRRFLAARPDFHREKLPFAELPLSVAERAAAKHGSWQLLPQEQGTDGFFMALLRKDG